MPTLLQAEELTLRYAERTVLDRVSLTVSTGDRLALLGRNGAGKTTLLRLLAGQRPPDEGQVWRETGLRFTMLEQQPVYPPGVTVQQLIEQANPYRAAQQQLDQLAGQLHDPEVMERWTTLQGQFEAGGGYGWPTRAARMLGVLDLTRFQDREAATLSGGEQTRLGLALALAGEPDLLLLDEPTNHLDIRMREWLETQLLAFSGGLVLTSHDREFLDRVATRSLWIEQGEAAPYPGGYSRARDIRTLERRTAGRLHRLSVREEQRLSGSAEQLDRWGRRSRAVKSRLARTVVAEAPQAERAIRMRLMAGQARARLVLWAEHVSKSYGPRPVLTGAALKVRQGDRVALMGANGTGKTTLLRLLAGQEFPDHTTPPATLQVAAGVQVVTLDQTWHGLDPDRGLKAQFEARFGARATTLLGRAGFREDDWAKTVLELSGGERARAGLALVSALRADLLLLDEPTNHLDIEALEALEAAVQAYGGAVIIVTHDRRFAREVATRLWLIEDTVLREVGGWDDRTALDPARTLEGDPPPPPPPPTARELLREQETRLQELNRELDRLDLTGREEARLRSERHRRQQEVYLLLEEVYGAAQYDHEVRSGPLRVRAQRFEAGGGMFWAARDLSCPHLAWDGHTLRWSDPPPGWYGAALLGAALQLLFTRWNVGQVRLGEGGPQLSRRRYFERLGYVRQGT
ncbi:ABC-F family ATP-binding cassette domain-containing protein [Deinococcus sonorensis]|uniref:ABC-F family ATP-binding cassette domain-containing protein n=2 Tax=Deinococcus sonorensis TaxID=309891 RepID=A0AAU7U7X5_9DEIO